LQTLIQTTDFKQLCFDVTWLRWSTLKNIDFAVVLDGWNCGDMLFFFLNELRKLWGAIPQNKTHTHNKQTNKKYRLTKKRENRLSNLAAMDPHCYVGPDHDLLWYFMYFSWRILRPLAVVGFGAAVFRFLLWSENHPSPKSGYVFVSMRQFFVDNHW